MAARALGSLWGPPLASSAKPGPHQLGGCEPRSHTEPIYPRPYSLRGGILGYCPAKPPQIPFNDTKIFGYCYSERVGAGGAACLIHMQKMDAMKIQKAWFE